MNFLSELTSLSVDSGATEFKYLMDILLIALCGALIFLLIQTRKLRKATDKLWAYNEKIMEADKLKQRILETENAVLQAQIKPHFLFNALNSIASLAYIDGQKAAELIGHLSTYLRNSIENENLQATVNIAKELELVDAYVMIEKARFKELVTLEKDFSSDLFFKLPPITIQPLVENAIKHGLKNSLEGIKVRLTIRDEVDGYLICIMDNGKGIEKEKLERLLLDEDDHKSIGLINTHSRLMRLYGKGLIISSESGVGTQVCFRIPKGEQA